MRAMSEEIMKRLGNRALGALLACSLVPVPAGVAWADEPAAGAGSGNAAGAEAGQLALEPGTYVEHEAIAYVMDGGARTLSSGGGALDGAQDLMDIAAGAAAEALGGDADASEAAAFARSLSANGEAEAPAGRLVLVRDEGKTTEQLIAELEADPRVVFAEPNAVVETIDADEEAAQIALSDEALVGEWVAEAATADADGGSGEAGAADGPGGPDAAGAAGEVDETGAASVAGETDMTATSEGAEDGASQGGAAGAGDDSDAAGETDATEPAPAANGDASAASIPDLTEFQWYADNDGRMAGVSAEEAADVDYGDWNNPEAATSLDEVVVAVLDNGVDASNPDLAPVMWSWNDCSDATKAQLQDIPGADEHGFSAGAPGTTSTTGIANYHGTHVAGIIGAEWNGMGTSGIAPNASILSVRHDDTLSGILRCLDYLAAARYAGVPVEVVNNSWTMGQPQWRSIDLAITAIGKRGITSVFGVGNSARNNDEAPATPTLLADNPYVVAVSSLDVTGEMSPFSQYGETTADVMAPGGGILSTYGTAMQQYLAEGDAEAVLYQSFDGSSHAAAGVDEAEAKAFTFHPRGSSDCSIEEVGDQRRFDGDAALEVTMPTGVAILESSVIDLSGVEQPPTHMSIRYMPKADEAAVAGALVQVKMKNGDWIPAASLIPQAFGLGGGSWGGFSLDLSKAPEFDSIDWEHFQIQILCMLSKFSYVDGLQYGQPGGPEAPTLVPGTLVIDSIGLGSDTVPYTYLDGTSMATPAAAGAAAVLAGAGLAEVEDDPAKSAEKLAALLRAAAEPNAAYEGLCSTGGSVSVDNALVEDDLGPAITAVADAGGEVKVQGYFMPEGTAVSLDGAPAEVTGRLELGDGKAELTVQKPAGFAGGQVVVRAEANGKHSKQLADFGERTDTVYYDQTGLPVPEGLDERGAWQLVGYNGLVYCLPRSTVFEMASDPSVPLSCIWAYDPDRQLWSEVALPSELIEPSMPEGGSALVDATGTTVDGKLLLRLTMKASTESASDGVVWLTMDSNGSWERCAGVQDEADGALMLATLGSDGKNVYLFGGYNLETKAENSIYRVDPNGGLFEAVGQLSRPRSAPQVSYGNGAFLVSSGVGSLNQGGGISGVDRVTMAQDGTAVSEKVDGAGVFPEGSSQQLASGAVADGFMLAGIEGVSGATDTFTLDAADGSVADYGKRASHQKLLTPVATAYNGNFYVLAATENAPYRIFSATAVETVAQPGDYVAPGPEPGPEPEPTPTPLPEPDPAPTDADGSGATLQPLASTGDVLGAPTAALAAVGVGALATLALAAAVLRRRSVNER